MELSPLRLLRPVHLDYPISSTFGIKRKITIKGKTTYRTHWGYDFACPKNSIIRAMADGYVYKAGWQSYNRKTGKPNPYIGFGLRLWQEVVIQGKELWLFYGHYNDVWARSNQYLKEGEMTGLSGSTGRSGGPHLHVEARLKGTWKRIPIDFIEKKIEE